mmetsp:Transcript_7876/g.15955  ORF Transcript_7876/g.15955 Transcript_7876/m.15955 type:complete len:200 (+) Transcript_7876:127-726(+)
MQQKRCCRRPPKRGRRRHDRRRYGAPGVPPAHCCGMVMLPSPLIAPAAPAASCWWCLHHWKMLARTRARCLWTKRRHQALLHRWRLPRLRAVQESAMCECRWRERRSARYPRGQPGRQFFRQRCRHRCTGDRRVASVCATRAPRRKHPTRLLPTQQLPVPPSHSCHRSRRLNPRKQIPAIGGLLSPQPPWSKPWCAAPR